MEKLDLTDISSSICIQSGEDDGAVGKVFWHAFLHDEGAYYGGDGRSLFPVDCLGIRPAG